MYSHHGRDAYASCLQLCSVAFVSTYYTYYMYMYTTCSIATTSIISIIHTHALVIYTYSIAQGQSCM